MTNGIRQSESTPIEPSLADLRRELAPLFRHRPLLYWADLLVSVAAGWTLLVLAIRHAERPWVLAALALGAAFAFLRSVLFIHEISHFRRGVLPGFTWTWNLVVGLPMLLPSFMYEGTHTDHHKRHLYGTLRDPEYLPLAHLGRMSIVYFILEMPLVPLLLVLRFGLLSPLSWIVPSLRTMVVERMSALVINKRYRRRAPEGAFRRDWMVMEVLLFAWVVSAFALAVRGVLPWRALAVWYLVATLVAVINQIRTLTAHHYENDGRALDTREQLVDSVNVLGPPILTELVFPVGLRYHALHHWLADMPYHSLGRAHAWLMKNLPSDSPYRETVYGTLMPVVRRLWRVAKGAAGRPAHWQEETAS